MDDLALASIDFIMREAALFAAAGFLVFGLSDLLVDIIWIGIVARRRLGGSDHRLMSAKTLAAPSRPGRIAIFIPAWDESAVIGKMLKHACAVLDRRGADLQWSATGAQAASQRSGH
jgi:adsorption protein B